MTPCGNGLTQITKQRISGMVRYPPWRHLSTFRVHAVNNGFRCWRRKWPSTPTRESIACSSSSTVVSHSDEASSRDKQRVVVLTGPTGVGKTKTSLALAKHLNAEIISADSVQVYTGLDIGSDKVPEAEQNGITHHLIDILPPSADFSAGDFYDLGREVVKDILARGKTPLVVGGTGFYLKWFLNGKADTPRSTPEGEAAANNLLEEEYAKAATSMGRECTEDEKWDIGVKLVRDAGDARSAQRLEESRNNHYRLRRILEVIMLTGRPMPADIPDGQSRELDYDFRCFFLHRPRIDLYRKIDMRCEEMVVQGILQESQELLRLGMLPNSCNASRAIGYRQVLELLTSEDPDRWAEPGDAEVQALQNMTKDMQTASRRLVTRQLTWFRDNAMFKWVNAADGQESVLSTIASELERPQHQGGSGDYGRLTPEQAQQVKRYQSTLEVLHDPEICKEVLREAAKHWKGRVHASG